MPCLYLVATPIGNLEDITLRALRILKEAGLIAAEDTRTTKKLLNHYNIHTPLTSYHRFNQKAKIPFLLEKLKEMDVALVSEAGTPGINDPGYDLVVACIERGVKVIPIPGPSAITSALAISGLPTDNFLYLGFPPKKKGERRRLFQSISYSPYTLILLESPHRLRESLQELREILGERRVAICRELTKLHEEVFRGDLSQALEHFSNPRGEFTIIIEGAKIGKPEITPQIERKIKELKLQGVKAKEAISQIAFETGLSKKPLYQLWLRV